MRAHAWKNLGRSKKNDPEDTWHCALCGAYEDSLDEPWTRPESDRLYITSIVCGGGFANVPVRADCEEEEVRQVMMS